MTVFFFFFLCFLYLFRLILINTRLLFIFAHTMSERIASVERTTSETHISCTIDLDHIPGVTEQKINVSTGIGFLDHVRVAASTFESWSVKTRMKAD